MRSVQDAEILQASIKAGSAAQIVVAVIAVIGLIYLLKLVMVTTLFSILLAFVLEPFVNRLGPRIPSGRRSAAGRGSDGRTGGRSYLLLL